MEKIRQFHCSQRTEFFSSVNQTPYPLPLQLWLDASKGKGLEVHGTYARRAGKIYMDMTFTNKALQAMGDFAIQFNKNR